MPMEPQTTSAGLSTTRSFITALINSLQSPIPDPSVSLDRIPQSKPILLTLHVLFQNELLPALDLLDRNLVTRLRLASHSSPSPSTKPDTARDGQPTYYVRSAQPPRNNSRSHHYPAHENTTYYEVHLKAWNCSCPAFAIAAFPAHGPETTFSSEQVMSSSSESGAEQWNFGGLTQGEDLPVCKHLLACVLVEHSSAFAHMVEEREVSADELAGWAAGWGD